MSLLDFMQLRPQYPVSRQPGGSWEPYVPPDMRPSGLGPGYSVYQSSHGRNLAGLGEINEMEDQPFDGANSEGIETYPNELDMLAAADDTAGNGVFDPNDTHGNIHPDVGVFQDHQSLPGYVARDQFYELSEVRDLTKPDGRVMYVPGGAVSLQQGQQKALTEMDVFWEIPPGVSPFVPEGVPRQSTVDAPTAERPVHSSMGQATDEGRSYKPYYVAAGVGIALGLAYIAFKKK